MTVGSHAKERDPSLCSPEILLHFICIRSSSCLPGKRAVWQASGAGVVAACIQEEVPALPLILFGLCLQILRHPMKNMFGDSEQSNRCSMHSAALGRAEAKCTACTACHSIHGTTGGPTCSTFNSHRSPAHPNCLRQLLIVMHSHAVGSKQPIIPCQTLCECSTGAPEMNKLC